MTAIETPSECCICFGTGIRRPGRHQTKSCHGSQIYAGTLHRQVLVKDEKRVAWVDEGVADLILDLWEADQDTWVSCQGGSTKSIRASHPYVGFKQMPDKELVKAICHEHGWYTKAIYQSVAKFWIFDLSRTRDIL